MHFSNPLLVSALACAGSVAAAGVVGEAFGFAAGTTGGGDAEPVYPTSIDELTGYLTDSEPRVIILDQEFNYIGSEGTTTEDGCRPDSNTCPDNGGQDAINGANWCDGQTAVSVTYDTAGVTSIDVGSNKSIVGSGTSAVIRGKGLRITGGSNVIVQNIHITELNPQYIWGGDALTLVDTDLVWIDHVKTSLIGRQHIVAGYDASNRVTISNSEIDGSTSWSASCDEHHYWAILLLGEADKVTFQGNYIHHTSGRSPKVGGTTLLHAVNNFWYDNTGHAFDISENANVIAEGNVMQSVKTPLNEGAELLFSAPDDSANAACQDPLGYVCEVNVLTDCDSDFSSAAVTSFLSSFEGEGVTATSASDVANSVKANAGVGKL
ncbi:polysaccharide lyase family 1 protein [Lophiostoma macrostomum CBS 122681]|uniref:pectin lyase n=1 Tax=Lophiostoma macrostomum CBS 122681 TaxID=1314788 RepID=A0A6A6SI39_9PLEO|nr:polysaccharide lyase family 1 protein [Lophiostoma macrostomum CBS 122681]